MENTNYTTQKKLIKLLGADRHSLLLSIVLHLLPGVLVVGANLVIAAPLVQVLGYPPYLAWTIALCLILLPVELGLLLYLGKKRNGNLSLRGVIEYREKPTKAISLIGLVIALMIWVFIASFLLTPVDSFVYSHLFTWIPFQGTAGSSGFLTGSDRSTVIVTLMISLIFTGMILPAIEELYFRGYLLPRIAHIGKWAPILNMVLFSLYHFWTPWQFISRIGFFLPTVWVTWHKKDLRVSLWVHCLSNTMIQLLALIAILLGSQ